MLLCVIPPHAAGPAPPAPSRQRIPARPFANQPARPGPGCRVGFGQSAHSGCCLGADDATGKPWPNTAFPRQTSSLAVGFTNHHHSCHFCMARWHQPQFLLSRAAINGNNLLEVKKANGIILEFCQYGGLLWSHYCDLIELKFSAWAFSKWIKKYLFYVKKQSA